jgi:release factor glutamine methyltransferase
VTFLELRELLADRTSDPIAVRFVLEEVVGESRSALLLTPDREMSDDDVRRALALVEEFVAGVPLQHVLGHWTFRDVELIVDERALIPRPETELVVEAALHELDRMRQGRPRPCRALDLGTGTGAIAVSLVRECPDVFVVATDVSRAALDLAKCNGARLAPAERERLEYRLGDWWEALAESEGSHDSEDRFDLICSNPPYLSVLEWNDLDKIVRDHDPFEALVGGAIGTEQIERVVMGARDHVADGGALVVEIGWLQGPVAADLARASGATYVEVLPDLAGRDRILLARW